MPSFQSCGPAPTAAAVLRWHKTLCVQSLLRLAAIAAGRGDAALTSVRCDYDDSRAVPLALALALLPLPARARPGRLLGSTAPTVPPRPADVFAWTIQHRVPRPSGLAAPPRPSRARAPDDPRTADATASRSTMSDSRLSDELHQAILDNDTDAAQRALAAGAAFVPDAVLNAVKEGDVAPVRDWLRSGGDANALVQSHHSVFLTGGTLLHEAAGATDFSLMFDPAARKAKEQRWCEIARELLAHGARCDFVGAGGGGNTPLLLASIWGRTDMCQLLCEAGAEVNYKRPSSSGNREEDDFSLMFAIKVPSLVRVLLRFGADPSMTRLCTNYGHPVLDQPGAVSSHRTPEEEAIFQAELTEDLDSELGITSIQRREEAEMYRESAHILAGARTTRTLHDALVLRALCHRGRATFTTETPTAFVRLVGGPVGGPAPTSRLIAPGLPDPLVALVCHFWLGAAHLNAVARAARDREPHRQAHPVGS